MKKVLHLVILFLVVLFLMYELSYSIYYSQTTGILQAYSPGAALTVTRQGYSVVNIGTGSGRVRLKPGSYQLIASKEQSQITKNFTITNKSLTTLNVGNVPVANQVSSGSVNAANSLINNLPFLGPASEYRIDYIYTFNNSIATPVITIYATSDQAKQDALAWISSQGINPALLNIRYLADTPNHSSQNNDAL